jgi:hypothetical protein
VVLARIDGVHADDVGVDLLEIRDVPLARVAIGERIGVALTCGGVAVRLVVLLVGDALEEAADVSAMFQTMPEVLGAYNCVPLLE